MEEITGKFKFDGDSKRYHRYKVKADNDIVGSLYIPQDGKIPDKITLEKQTQAEGRHVT